MISCYTYGEQQSTGAISRAGDDQSRKIKDEYWLLREADSAWMNEQRKT